jgi:hypothetical protein
VTTLRQITDNLSLNKKTARGEHAQMSQPIYDPLSFALKFSGGIRQEIRRG